MLRFVRFIRRLFYGPRNEAPQVPYQSFLAFDWRIFVIFAWFTFVVSFSRIYISIGRHGIHETWSILLQSKPHRLVLTCFILSNVMVLLKMLSLIFFGGLRQIEFEHLVERSSISLTDTFILLMLMQTQLNAKLIYPFAILFISKWTKWLLNDRLGFLESRLSIPIIDIIRVIICLFGTLIIDLMSALSYLPSLSMTNPNVNCALFLEYFLETVESIRLLYSYFLFAYETHVTDDASFNKQLLMLYGNLFGVASSLFAQILFFTFLVHNFIFPFISIRSFMVNLSNFRKYLKTIVHSRRAIQIMERQFADVTPAEIQQYDSTCIICREDMGDGSSCKKLPCGHILHMDCLRSWFQRQQACPLCRTAIFSSNSSSNSVSQQNNQQNINNNSNNSAPDNNPQQSSQQMANNSQQNTDSHHGNLSSHISSENRDSHQSDSNHHNQNHQNSSQQQQVFHSSSRTRPHSRRIHNPTLSSSSTTTANNNNNNDDVIASINRMAHSSSHSSAVASEIELIKSLMINMNETFSNSILPYNISMPAMPSSLVNLSETSLLNLEKEMSLNIRKRLNHLTKINNMIIGVQHMMRSYDNSLVINSRLNSQINSSKKFEDQNKKKTFSGMIKNCDSNQESINIINLNDDLDNLKNKKNIKSNSLSHTPNIDNDENLQNNNDVTNTGTISNPAIYDKFLEEANRTLMNQNIEFEFDLNPKELTTNHVIININDGNYQENDQDDPNGQSDGTIGNHLRSTTPQSSPNDDDDPNNFPTQSQESCD